MGDVLALQMTGHAPPPNGLGCARNAKQKMLRWKEAIHPGGWTRDNIAAMKAQLKRLASPSTDATRHPRAGLLWTWQDCSWIY
jgi:hypothetical protein